MLLTTLFLFLAAPPAVTHLPPGKGKAIVQRSCAGCHALRVVVAKRASKEQWSVLVDQMISRGAEIDDEEVEIVVDYLAKNFGVTKTPAIGTKSATKNPTQSGH